MPGSFQLILDYVKTLKFEQKPDYKYITDLLHADIKKLNINPNYEF